MSATFNFTAGWLSGWMAEWLEVHVSHVSTAKTWSERSEHPWFETHRGT